LATQDQPPSGVCPQDPDSEPSSHPLSPALSNTRRSDKDREVVHSPAARRDAPALCGPALISTPPQPSAICHLPSAISDVAANETTANASIAPIAQPNALAGRHRADSTIPARSPLGMPRALHAAVAALRCFVSAQFLPHSCLTFLPLIFTVISASITYAFQPSGMVQFCSTSHRQPGFTCSTKQDGRASIHVRTCSPVVNSLPRLRLYGDLCDVRCAVQVLPGPVWASWPSSTA
jgi:hypothetical protein